MLFVFLVQIVVVWNNVDVDPPPCESSRMFAGLVNPLTAISCLGICSNYHGMRTKGMHACMDDFDFVRLCVCVCVEREWIEQARIKLGQNFPKSFLECLLGVRTSLEVIVNCPKEETARYIHGRGSFPAAACQLEQTRVEILCVQTWLVSKIVLICPWYINILTLG